jgi:ketosteroid isomerase-like protein
MMRVTALSVAVLLSFGLPAYAQKAQIEAANAKFMQLFSKGDFSGLGQLYLQNANAFPPGSPMVKGRSAIAAMWQKMADQITEPKVTILDVKRLSPTAAREIGTFSLKTKGANPQEVVGKYVVVWQRERGEWKIESDIWNDGK